MSDGMSSARNGEGQGFWRRFYLRLLLVLAALLGLLVAAALNMVSLWAALLLGGGLVVLAAVIPDTSEDVSAVDGSAALAETAFADAVRKLADALPEAVIILDRRSVVVHRNPEALRQFPQAREGQPLAFSLRYPPVLDAIRRARQGGVETVEMHRTIPTESWHRVTIAPLSPGDPAPEGVLVMTLTSLTEARRLEALRSDFIANASHELRTPLAALAGFIDTLLGPAANDAPARERFLGLMRAQAARMSKLIDDLLSLSRIEMRQHMRPVAPVDLALLIREVVSGLDPLARESGTSLSLTLGDGPAVVPGDRDELYEVFENLVENAIKYGAEGGAVEIAAGPASRPGALCEVTVTDHGPGVAAEHVPRLTERFYRVDAESSRRKKGTGLGLAIVKHIVTRHHGELQFRSAPGEGMRVTVTLRS